MRSRAEAGAALLGGRLRDARPLAGGDLSQPVRIALEDGRTAIVKDGPAPPAEARMLQAIAAAGVPAPAVLAVSDSLLALAPLDDDGGLGGRAAAAVWADLGRVLSRLHACRGAGYGWPEDYAFSPVAIANAAPAEGQSPPWPAFWAERRLRPFLDHLPAEPARRLADLADALSRHLPAQPPPALLHGDLWGGNVLVSGDRVSGLIDPACYYGHGEVDIAMLTLFDRPGPAFFRAYGALAPGHERRLAIYRLWPALVHLRLFGGGYLPLVERQLALAGA